MQYFSVLEAIAEPEKQRSLSSILIGLATISVLMHHVEWVVIAILLVLGILLLWLVFFFHLPVAK
jgi:hypothetical protein